MIRPVAESVETIQTAMDDLPASATMSERAIAIAQLGFPVWFACQEQQGFVLAQAPGGPMADPEKAFTTSVDKLKNRTLANGVNTVAVTIPHPQGGEERHVFNLRTCRIEPWKIFVFAGFDRPKPAPASSTRSERVAPAPFEIRPLQETLIDLKVASDEFGAASQQLAKAKAKEASLVDEQKGARAQASKLSQGLSDRLAQDILAGREIDDSHPETAKVRKLNTKAEAIANAIPLAQAATREAQAIANHAEQIRSTAILDWAASQQHAAVQDVISAVRAMAPSLATLAAVDRVKSQLFGKQVVTGRPGHPGLISTERLVVKLIKELPDRVRPPALTSSTFETAITDAVSAIRSNLENDQ